MTTIQVKEEKTMNQEIMAEIKCAQVSIVREVNKSFEELIKKLDEMKENEGAGLKTYETIYPISADPSNFKGEKPTCVIFGTERVIARTWKDVFKHLILKCNSDQKKHEALMELRNKVLGRERTLLSNKPDGMLRPFKIDDKMYAETHYDTESLIRILLHRILDEVEFDYSNISVGVKN